LRNSSRGFVFSIVQTIANCTFLLNILISYVIIVSKETTAHKGVDLVIGKT
jgi:hypothetical protein